MTTEHERALEEVRAAFPATPIDARGAFVAWGMTYSDADDYARHIDGKRWPDLDRAYLDLRSDAIGFLGTEQLVAVLPAYLVQLLEGDPFSQLPDMLLVTLTMPGANKSGSRLGKKRFEAMVDALASPQRAAVASALDRFAGKHPETAHAYAAQLALDVYWHDYLEQAISGKQNARENCKAEAP